MTENLRPMSLGEILDRSFQIYRAKFLVFVGIAALPALVMFCLHVTYFARFNAYVPVYFLTQNESNVWRFLVALGFYHIASFISLMIFPAYVILTSKQVFSENESLRGSIRFVAARWQSYLWIALLKLSAQLIAPVFLAAGVMLGLVAILDFNGGLGNNSGLHASLIVLPPTLVCVVLFLWIGSSLSLAIPAAALDLITGVKALRRSWGLTKESRWRIIFLWTLILIAALAFEYGIRLLLGWTVFYAIRLHLYRFSQPIYMIAIHCISMVISSLVGPIYPIALTLIYYDQRIRQEGYDIERMMDAAGLNAPSTSPFPAEETQA